MKVIYVEPMAKARIIDIKEDLKAYQELVEGTIQVLYPWPDPVGLVCNDEAKLIGMEPNRALEDYDIICGPFFITGLSEESFAEMEEPLLHKYLRKFLHPEGFLRIGDKICVVNSEGKYRFLRQ